MPKFLQGSVLLPSLLSFLICPVIAPGPQSRAALSSLTLLCCTNPEQKVFAVQCSVTFPGDGCPPPVGSPSLSCSIPSPCLFNSWDLGSDSEAQLQMFKSKQIPPLPMYAERPFQKVISGGTDLVAGNSLEVGAGLRQRRGDTFGVSGVRTEKFCHALN